MICEQCRIKIGQDNFYSWCLKNIPIGREVTQEDREGIERVVRHNIKDRERLFGSSRYVWYLKRLWYEN